MTDSLTHRITTEQAWGPPALAPHKHAAQWTSICKRAKFALSSFVVTAQVPTPIPALTSRRERPLLRAVHFGRQSAHRGHSLNEGPRPDGACPHRSLPHWAAAPNEAHIHTNCRQLLSPFRASPTSAGQPALTSAWSARVDHCLPDAHKVAL